jgi:hypothetical protein
MFQRCRPARRLFYLVLAVIVATWSVRVSAPEDLSGTKAGKAAPPSGEAGCGRTLAAGGFAVPPKWADADQRGGGQGERFRPGTG